MSHGTHIPAEPPKEPSGHPLSESFSKWAWRQIPFIITQVLAFLTGAASFIYYLKHGSETIGELVTIQQFERILYYLNLGFCIYCVWRLIRYSRQDSVGEQTAKRLYRRIFNQSQNDEQAKNDELHATRLNDALKLLRRFKGYFLAFWIMMTALYLCFLAKDKEEPPPGRLARVEQYTFKTYLTGQKHDDIAKERISKRVFEVDSEHSFVNYFLAPNDTSIGEHGAINYLREPLNSIKGKDTVYQKTREEGDSIKEIKPLHSALEAIGEMKIDLAQFFFNTAGSLMILWCFSVLAVRVQSRGGYIKQYRLVYSSLFFTVVFLAMYPLCIGMANHGGLFYPESLASYATFFDAMSGVFNAFVLALLIARLDSKLIALPSGLIGALYLYSAVQPLFVVFGLPGFVQEAIKVMVLALAFLLKIYFFFIITYALQKGKILAYLYCFDTLNERVDSIVENHFEIRFSREEPWAFKILRYDSESYIGVSCHTLSECKIKVSEMREAASIREYWNVEEENDKLYVVLRNKKGEKLLSSYEDLSSREEGEELIDEATVKLPCCYESTH